MVVESFAGPHDMANSISWYVNTEEQAAVLTFLTEEPVSLVDALQNNYYNDAQKTFLENATNRATSLLFALPFASAAIIEQSGVIPGTQTK